LDAFDPGRGQDLTGESFARAVEWGRARGARNVQWIGGEPTIHLPAILEVMSGVPDLPPVVWKSDFHGTPEAFELLDGVVETYVADLKFGNDDCARRLAGVDHYFGTVTRNLRLASRQQARVIVRHLLLPGHVECCLRPIIDWMRAEMPGVPFSLRDGYLPSWRARQFVEISHPLGRADVRRARELAASGGLNLIQ
jgi:putative pyruvate formate lyase activating enzyme